VLDWDTPGGNVLGIPALAQSIRRLAAAKPTVSVSTGTMASAGYWAGCAANAVYISGLTDNLGSLGVVATHRYDPRATQVQTTEIAVGRYKRMASESGPLTAEGEAYIRAQLDEVYRVLINSVADSRNASVDDVLEHMADGRLFIGQQALDAGLADGVATVDDLVEQMATEPSRFAKRRTAAFAAARPAAGASAKAAGASSLPIDTTGVASMTPQEQAAKFVAENPEAAVLLRAEGAAGERGRIQAVRGQLLAGHEKLIEQLAFDGKTTGPEAAVAVLNAERTLAATRVSDIAADTPPPLASDATAAADGGAQAAETPAATSPMAEARQLAAAMAKKQAEAAAAGQTLSAVDALALVRKETANA
jgi:capsid assembly protease